MRSIKGSIVCLVLLTGIPGFAQQAAAGASAQQSTSASAAGASVNESSNVNAGASMPQMRPVAGELVEKLDSKTARVGDSVVVKTTASVRSADGVVIPKGTRLVGHVTDVRAHARGSEESSLTVQFDRAELKGGQTMSIHSVIESVSPSPAAMAMASSDADDTLGLSGAGMRSSGGARGGLGGALSGTGSAAGGATGALATTTSATNSGLNTAAAAGNLGGTASAATGSLQTAASGTAATGARATAIPGVMLAGDATGATSGTLSASRRNVHLDSGTQIVLGVAASANR